MNNYCTTCLWYEKDDYAICPYSTSCITDNNGVPTKYKQKIEGKFAEKRTKSTVEHPKHYNRDGAMECIDEMVLLFGVDETATFCKLNAWKYRYRAADKNGEEDLKKSDEYIKKYKELKDSDTFSYSITPAPHMPLSYTSAILEDEKLAYTE